MNGANPFITLWVYFDPDFVEVGKNDIDTDGEMYSEYERFQSADDPAILEYLDQLVASINSEDVTTQVMRGVGAKQMIQMANDVAGEDRFGII